MQATFARISMTADDLQIVSEAGGMDRRGQRFQVAGAKHDRHGTYSFSDRAKRRSGLIAAVESCGLGA